MTGRTAVSLGGMRANRPPLPALTTLRFLLACHVALFHMWTYGVLPGPPWFARFASFGYITLTCFFLLSGFILVYTHADRPIGSGQFWWARFARIYPAYFFSLVLTFPFFYHHALVAHAPDHLYDWDAQHFKLSCTLTLTLLQSWVPLAALSWNPVCWSLAVEAFFYLLFPFLLTNLLRCSKTRLLLIIVGCWIASLAYSGAYCYFEPDGLAYRTEALVATWLDVVKFNPLVRLPEFVMGMAVGILFLRGEPNLRLALPLMAFGVGAIVTVLAFRDRLPYIVIHTGLLGPAFAAIIFSLGLRPRWSRLLEQPFLVLCGNASYSFYLLHVAIFLLVFHGVHFLPVQKTWLGAFLAMATVLSIAIVAYQRIEKPALEYLIGLQKKRKIHLQQVANTT